MSNTEAPMSEIDEEMVEAAAKQLFNDEINSVGRSILWDADYPQEPYREEWLRRARAALTAALNLSRGEGERADDVAVAIANEAAARGSITNADEIGSFHGFVQEQLLRLRPSPDATAIREECATLTEICRSAMCGPHQECDDQHPCSCRDAAQAIVAAGYSRPAPAPEGWRTIDSAPKDGTEVDLWCRSPGIHGGGLSRIADCWYSSGKWWRHDFEHGDDQCRSIVHNATHWCPLPSPPQQKEAEK